MCRNISLVHIDVVRTECFLWYCWFVLLYSPGILTTWWQLQLWRGNIQRCKMYAFIERNIQYIWQFKLLYISPPGRAFHFSTNSPSIWEAFSNAPITARIQFTHISTPVYSQMLLYTAAWTGASWRERKCPSFETAAKGIRTQALPAFFLWAAALPLV